VFLYLHTPERTRHFVVTIVHVFVDFNCLIVTTHRNFNYIGSNVP
jgi:hypothetical protein